MTDRVTLTEAAVILEMRAANVAAFLERRGVYPVDRVAYRRRWARRDVERVRDEYRASERYEADQRRKEAWQ